MKKRVLSLTLVLALCFGLFPTVASAADSDFVVKDLTNERGYFHNVLVAYNGPGGDVVIPDGICYVGLGLGLNSSGEGGGVFAGRRDITSVTIPDSAIAIGGNAFAECTGLTSLTIPDGVREIATEAFIGCTGLTSVTISGSVKKIHTAAFSGCTGLTNLTLEEGIEIIGGESFRGCTSLASVTFPNSVTTIKSIAFLDCTSLTDIKIPETADIEGNPFGGAPWLTKQGDWVVVNGTLVAYQGSDANVVIPNTVTSIGGGWNQCPADDFSSITIPQSVTKIKDNAFWHFGNLKSIEIPNSVTEIGSRAFADTGLTHIEIPDSVTVIGNAAFEECNKLTSVVIPSSVIDIDPSKGGIPAFDGSPNVTIHGSAGSYAEEYANKHGIPFVADLTPVSTVGGFRDVQEGAYYAEPVLWAVEKGITAGTSESTFSPEAVCTKAEILTFLWRSQGEPEPTIEAPYSGLTPNDFYYKAAVWACEKGIIGSSDFGRECTRSFAVTYLWKLAGGPPASTTAFTDVPSTADYAQAVAWAVKEGITSGTSSTTFSPETVCTRGQIVTLLWRTYK